MLLFFFYQNICYAVFIYQHKNMVPKKNTSIWFVVAVVVCVNGYLSYFQSVSCVNRLRFLARA